MATKLYLRNSTGGFAGVTPPGSTTLRDFLLTPGAAVQSATAATTAGGTGIPFQVGGVNVRWVSPEVQTAITVSAAGTVSVWGQESNMSANAGLAVHFYVWRGGNDTWSDGNGLGEPADNVELGTTMAEMTWVGALTTNTNVNVGDRLGVAITITGVGTMGAGFTCTMNYDAADGATGDSFVEFAENIDFGGAPAATHSGWWGNMGTSW
jgi:hypothetical protein